MRTRQTQEERRTKARAASLKWRKENPEKHKALRNKWKKDNPEKVKAEKARWFKENRDKENKRSAEWKRNNPKKTKACFSRWRIKNIEKMKKLLSEWRKAHPETCRAYCNNRRSLKIGNGGKLSPGLEAKLLAFQKNRCAICRTSLKKTGHHLDHIIPLTRGGKNIDSNAQITCPTCNLEKNSKDPIQFMRERGFLL